ncbi:unnamed protein product, partial [Didymodactylos carnosus]
PYPQSIGDYAVYTDHEFIDQINYAINRYNNMTKISLGLFGFNIHNNGNASEHEKNVKICLNRFHTCIMFPSNHTYQLNPLIEDSKLNFVTIEFVLNTIQLKNLKPFSQPDCYHFQVKLIFDNNARTGKIRVRLDSQAELRSCNGKLINPHDWTLMRRDLLLVYDCFVLIISFISFILCVRSLYQGHRLCKEVVEYYNEKYVKNRPKISTQTRDTSSIGTTNRKKKREIQPNKLQFSEYYQFYSPWYFLMIITDLLVIAATIIKIYILFKLVDNYDAAGLLLGISSLLAWFGVLRYLSFFKKYNLLFVTIKRALPLLLRYVLCVLIIFCGFMFCGWIVLGPYHSKFRTITTTCENMFSLIAGDDMYTTFTNLKTESIYVSLFCRLYLFTYISLFIYVVSSLVIALVIDGYDTVKTFYKHGFPKSVLERFSEEDLPLRERRDTTTATDTRALCLPCCCPS